jgi:predicted flap endonuclease-1-like 5' DNA nuclease
MDERTGNAFGGEIEDPEAKRREEEAGLAKAALEANKPAPTGVAAPASSPINPITPVKIDAPKEEIKFGEKTAPQKLAVANAAVKPTNHGSATIDDLGKLVQIGTSMAGAMNQGGRIHRDLGGGMPYSNGDSIVPQQDNAKPQLMTAQGTGAGGGGTGKAIGQIAGLASTLIPGGGAVKKGLGIVSKVFSDERMKENIRPIGELFDGQKVHSFNYKGDPRTQIGLIAQEVEHHRPHAVDHDHGMKTVDYHDATQHAVRRGHFAEGGMPEEAVNSILAGLRRRSDPRFNPHERNLQQDEELRQNLYPDMSPKERVAGLEPMPPADFNEGTEEMVAPKKPEGGLGVPMDNAPIDNTPLPTGLSAIGKLIFAAEGDGQAKTSSALGRYGIVKDTYVSYFKKAFPQRARELGDAGIKALRTTPEGRKLNLQFGPMIIADNAKHLQKYGFDTNARNVYLAHFLGPSGAVRALKANPNTPVEMAVDKDAIDANPDVFAKRKIRTVGELLNWTGNTMARRAKEAGLASGGVAGRDGYQVGGKLKTPEELLAMGMDPNTIPSGDPTKPPSDEERMRDIIEKTPIQNITPATGTRKVGPLVEEPAKPAGLSVPVETVPVTATAKDLERIGYSESAPISGLAVNNGAISSASNVADTQDATQKTPGLAPPTATPKKANVFQRVLGYDKSKPYDPKTNRKFFQRLGHGETDAVLAALKGLAAMGTARTENLGVALAAGIGEGADTFQGQREFGRKERETAAVEREAQSGETRALSDLAVAEQNIKDLPPRIAALRAFAAKGGPDAAEFLKAANDLQNILNRSQETLNKAGKAVVGAATPYVAPVATNARAPATGGAEAPAAPVAAPTAAKTAAPVRPKAGSIGDVFYTQDLYGIAGLNTPGTTNLAEIAKEGMVVNPDGSLSYDPDFVAAQLAIKTPQQKVELETAGNVEEGRTIFQNAVSKWLGVENLLPTIKSLSTLPKNVPPTTEFLSSLANIYGKLNGYSQKQMEQKFGPQPEVNDILTAAGIDPRKGIAGINQLVENMRIQARIARVSATAAENYRKVRGFDGGMQAYIDASVRASVPEAFK